VSQSVTADEEVGLGNFLDRVWCNGVIM
jgi:hypothetical protein